MKIDILEYKNTIEWFILTIEHPWSFTEWNE